MLYTLNLDNDNYVLSISNTPNDNIELDLSKLELEYLNAYQYIEGVMQLDNVKKQEMIDAKAEQEKQEEIAELKQYMNETDYIWNVIKEGDATEEDYADVIAQRHTKRLRIRELEG